MPFDAGATVQGGVWQVSDPQTAAVIYEESLGLDEDAAGSNNFRVLDAVAMGWVGLGAAGRARPSHVKSGAAKITVDSPGYSVADAATGAIVSTGAAAGGDGVDAPVGGHDRRRRLREQKGRLMAGTQFTFASMIHRGFLADQNARTEVTVTVPASSRSSRQVPMMTPGDVIGIPARQVIRCMPANGLVDAEPNYLATIEFDAPDLPWMFSRKPVAGRSNPGSRSPSST